MLDPNKPALILAPMDGVTDAPMRELIRNFGVFRFAVSEFVRVSTSTVPKKVFLRDIPELSDPGRIEGNMPVQVQLLGSDPRRMAESAINAVRAGALGIDINFGCPAPTVNRNDGGASLLRHPCRIRDVVRAVREDVPISIPVSAKLRLGWESIDDIFENAAMAVEGGASWLTIHARTKAQGYAPPVFWEPVRRVRESVAVPVVANGDIRCVDDFLRCRDETGCTHFMVGRGALANPLLPFQVAGELGIRCPPPPETDWNLLFLKFVSIALEGEKSNERYLLGRLKQWSKLAYAFGDFPRFHNIKRATSVEEFFQLMNQAEATG